MAPVVVEIAAENDLAVPLIAVHMFVFYFGLMADVSPPVGLAAYAAAAIAGADPMKVGWQGTFYELRTLLLPFIFIFSPEILMIDIGGPVHFVVVVATATLAMMAFVAALQGYFFARNRWWEAILLLLICFTLFRPHFWMDLIAPPFRGVPGADIVKVIDATPAGASLRFKVETTDITGDPTTKTVRIKLGTKGDARARLAETGITLASPTAPTLASVRPGSEAARLKLRPGDKVEFGQRAERSAEPVLVRHSGDPGARRPGVAAAPAPRDGRARAGAAGFVIPPFVGKRTVARARAALFTAPPAGRPPCCFQQRLPEACPSPHGSPSRTSSGRSGNRKAMSLPPRKPTPRCSRSRSRKTPASISSPTARCRASISCTASSNSSTASTSPTRSRWASARTATKRWCRRWSANCA